MNIQSLSFFCSVPLTKHLKDLILKLLEKNPEKRITIKEIKDHPWTTEGGKVKLPTESQNCRLVIVTEEDIQKSVKTIPKLDTLVIIFSYEEDFFVEPYIRALNDYSYRH